jgi:hypothetical protein
MLINGVGASGSGSVVESWNGHAWRTWSQQTSLCPISQGPCFTNDVSCGSATGCVAVGAWTNTGGSQQVVTGFRWERTHWVQSKVSLPFDGNPANAYQVSCAGLFCMTTGSAFQDVANGDVAAAATWNGQGAWNSAAPKLGVITCKSGFQPCAWTKAVSCGRPRELHDDHHRARQPGLERDHLEDRPLRARGQWRRPGRAVLPSGRLHGRRS